MVTWALRHQESEEYLLDLQAENPDRSIPILDAKPELNELQRRGYEAWALLSPARQVGLHGAVGVAVVEIEAMARITGLDPVWLLRVTRAADSAYLAHLGDSRPSHGHSPPRSGPRP